MSGGSYDYISYKIEEQASTIPTNGCPRRAAFKALMPLIAKAWHEIEWSDSGDCSPGNPEEIRAIEECLGFLKGNPGMIAKAAAFDEVSRWFKGYFSNKAMTSLKDRLKAKAAGRKKR